MSKGTRCLCQTYETNSNKAVTVLEIVKVHSAEQQSTSAAILTLPENISFFFFSTSVDLCIHRKCNIFRKYQTYGKFTTVTHVTFRGKKSGILIQIGRDYGRQGAGE